MRRDASLVALLCACVAAAGAQPALPPVLKLADLTTTEIRALDRAHTVVISPGGILEEHGPYLPSYTDGYANERVAAELATAIAKRPGWKALMFPPIPLGAGGANGIGGHFVFPGTYAVRPETLRAVYMDLATELGEQGFRWIFLVNLHGDPDHSAALDAAGDYFRDTYGGHMVHLMSLVVGARAADAIVPDAAKAEDGFTVHAGVEEHSLTLAIRPDLVGKGLASAPSITGKDLPDLRRIASADNWPGYFGAPRLATASIGRQLLAAEIQVRTDLAMKILDGADERQMQRYTALIAGVPGIAPIMADARAHDASIDARERAWITAHPGR